MPSGFKPLTSRQMLALFLFINSTQPHITTTMTEITTTEDVQIARENAAFEMLQRQAKMFAASSLVPKEFVGNVANCAIAINIAKRLGADPFMTIQNVDIIHGRPSFRATFLIAMVNAAGRFEPLQFRMEGEEGKPSRSCVAWTKSKPDGALLEGPKITLEMAKAEGWSTKNGSKWLTMPELMLRYRAAAFFARLYAPDITLGMMTAEEVADITERDVTPPKAESSPLFKPLAAKSPQTAASPATTYGDGASQASQNEAAESSPQVEASLLEQVRWKLKASDLKWSDFLTKLQQNDMGGTEFVSLDEADELTLKESLAHFDGIAQALTKKGGAK